MVICQMDNLHFHDSIIQSGRSIDQYPFESISPELLDVLKLALESFTPGANRAANPVLKIFECFLQITKKQLSLADLQKPTFTTVYKSFIGALYSESFLGAPLNRRYTYAMGFRRLIEELRTTFPEIPSLEISFPSTERGLGEMEEFVVLFHSLEKDLERVQMWKGWPMKNLTGRVSQLPFFSIYKRLGAEFTARLHRACSEYYGARRTQRIIGMNELAVFIKNHPEPLSTVDFRSPKFTLDFWKRFLLFYLRTSIENKVNASTAVRNWRNEFYLFVRDYLEKPGLFSPVLGGVFPMPPLRGTDPSATNIRRKSDGTEIKSKLVTEIPLQISDSEAMEILFRRIKSDVDIVTTWARAACADIWSRVQRRISLAKIGKPRSLDAIRYRSRGESYLSDQRNPDAFANACATFESNLFAYDKEGLGRFFPAPLAEMAKYFGLPTAGALLPHCALLVANHPKITPSFLESLVFFSKTGKTVGLVKSNGTTYLCSAKARIPSPEDQEQRIPLNAETEEIVRQIVEITRPLRNALKKSKNPDWRYLLLGCGPGFGEPKRVKRLATYTSAPDYVERTVESMIGLCDVPPEKARDLASQFSLPALRASVGVLVYIETSDLAKMSEALGHIEVDLDLLERYLPAPIRDFLQERWIRIFQQGLIVEALKDSKYLLAATKFDSMTEVNEFLSNHALDMPYRLDHGTAYKSKTHSKDSEVVIGVNVGVLTALVSLHQAVTAAKRTTCALSNYWSLFAHKIINFIDSKECLRSDLKSFLAQARCEPPRLH